MAWYSRIRDFFNRGRIEDSLRYREIVCRLEENRSLLNRFEEQTLEAKMELAEFRKVTDAKLREQRGLVSELEEKLSDRGAKFKETLRSYNAAKKDCDKIFRKYVNLSRRTDRLQKKLMKKNYKFASVKAELEDERTGAQEKIEEMRRSLRREYLGGLDIIAQKYDSLTSGFVPEAGTILKLNEKRLSLDKKVLVLFNGSCEPVAATMGTYRFFDLSMASDLKKIPLMDETIKQIKLKNSKPFCIQYIERTSESDVKKGDGMEIDVEILYARGNEGRVLGAFVFYTPKDDSWLKRVAHFDLTKPDKAKRTVQETFLDGLNNLNDDALPNTK